VISAFDANASELGHFADALDGEAAMLYARNSKHDVGTKVSHDPRNGREALPRLLSLRAQGVAPVLHVSRIIGKVVAAQPPQAALGADAGWPR
jgi:hypothetical protein